MLILYANHVQCVSTQSSTRRNSVNPADLQLGVRMHRVCLVQKNIQKYASRYPLQPRLACWTRYSSGDGKAVVWRVWKWAKCRASICQTLLCSDAVSLCFRLRSLARSRLDCSCSIFGSRTIFFTCRSPPGWTLLHFDSRMRTIFRSPHGQTSTTWLVVWGRNHRNRAHAIKVWQMYIHTNAIWLHCTISSLALRHSAKVSSQ